ncbi:haloacid dehalogenase type II [Vibrio sp. TH_r3]|uniref:haloacid dehalogenase type II n=1 Tax=Vibrio sp. TH_r3 TaxID=3082084 RepID=UPI00295520A2|nr:haloacid dehalogenase type II [Vibrio sp. TH_r3]MDV7103650.1 haloacid dehalogenase type II [Vibrio sp. TH_r3]
MSNKSVVNEIEANQTILFDINETVLNLDSLKAKFKMAFGDEQVTATWFSMLLHSSTVCILTKVDTDFATLAKINLQIIASRRGVTLSQQMSLDILNGFASLSAHDDMVGALKTLRNAGVKTVAFSNSSLALITAQITNAGLSEYFDDIVSVEQTGSFKPDPNVYKFVANKLNQPVQQLRLVATHDWDTHGALSVGMKAAYINRLNSLYNPLYLQPDIVANTMDEIVAEILRT